MALEKDLERFLRGILSSENKRVRKLVLRHAAPGAKGTEVDSFVPPDDLTLETLPLFVSDIISRAQTDADGLGGVNRYVIQAYQEGDSKPVGRYAFRMRGMDEEFDESSGEESPTMKGLLTQLMRHNEMNSKTMVQSMGVVLRSLGERIQSQDKQIEKLMDQRYKDAEILEQVHSKQHERDMDLLEATNAEARKDKIFEKLSLLMPAVVNRFVGKKVLPGDDPAILMVKEFAGSLSGEQINALRANLTAEQQIVLMQILQQSQQKQLS